MSKHGSLIHQMSQKLHSLKRFGESKHEAKQVEKARCEKLGIPWNPARVQGIFSHKTCDTYRNEMVKFIDWIKNNYVGDEKPRVLDKIDNSIIREYLRQNIDSGKSAYSIHLAAAAIVKVLERDKSDFGELPSRVQDNITRSRDIREHDKHVSLSRNQDIIDFCKGTGMRRSELLALKVDYIYEKDNSVYIEIIRGAEGGAKGGRPRTFKVVEEYKEHVLKCKNKAISEGRVKVWTHIVNRLDVHSLRREYAQNRYKEFESEGKGNGVIYTRRSDKLKLDKGVALLVSQELGHNRVDVVCRHYL